jgi:hypothetical protein
MSTKAMPAPRTILTAPAALALLIVGIAWAAMWLIFLIVGWHAPPLVEHHGALAAGAIAMTLAGAVAIGMGLHDLVRRSRATKPPRT